jgi:diadenosine tetraphosphate (Ap4A) HIT family hydrolase
MTLPYAEPLIRLEPQPRVIPEPPRVGEPGGDPCGLCSWLSGLDEAATSRDPEDEPLWYDDDWALCRATGVTIPGVVWLTSRAHHDSFADLPDSLARSYGPMVARVERAILALGDIARVHVYRWGDGSAHFHVWFYPRPLGMLEAKREMLALWADLLPEPPKEVVADAERKIAAALATGN